MMTSEQNYKTKLIEILERDYKSAKIRMQAFEEGTEEHVFNRATMLQAGLTLIDVRILFRFIPPTASELEILENFK